MDQRRDDAPIFTTILDGVLVCEGKAVIDPAELAALAKPPVDSPILVDSVDQLVQFTDQPE